MTLNLHHNANPALRLGALFATLTLAACASLGPSTPETLVEQRANARWQALLAGKFDDAYTFNTPGYRALVTPDAYRGRAGSAVKWTGAKVHKVTCAQADKCEARIRIDFQPPLGSSASGTFTTYITESWLLEADQWWIFLPVKP